MAIDLTLDEVSLDSPPLGAGTGSPSAPRWAAGS